MNKYGALKKISRTVAFPTDGLDLAEFVDAADQAQDDGASCVYDLAAVVEHHGSSHLSGHYSTTARRGDERGWWKFNDSSCARLPADAGPVTSDASVLVYLRRDLETVEVGPAVWRCRCGVEEWCRRRLTAEP